MCVAHLRMPGQCIHKEICTGSGREREREREREKERDRELNNNAVFKVTRVM